MNALILSLQNKHAKLERELAAELARPGPNEFVVRRLKLAKLHVRDELESLWRRRLELNRDRLIA